VEEFDTLIVKRAKCYWHYMRKTTAHAGPVRGTSSQRPENARAVWRRRRFISLYLNDCTGTVRNPTSGRNHSFSANYLGGQNDTISLKHDANTRFWIHTAYNQYPIARSVGPTGQLERAPAVPSSPLALSTISRQLLGGNETGPQDWYVSATAPLKGLFRTFAGIPSMS